MSRVQGLRRSTPTESFRPNAPAQQGLSHGGKITLLPDLSAAKSLSVLVHELMRSRSRCWLGRS